MEMEVGKLYKLKEVVENEHQDHFFTYPAGLILRLDYVSVERDYPAYGWMKSEYKIYHFDIPLDGMCYVFNEEDVEPATEADLADSKVHVIIERA